MNYQESLDWIHSKLKFGSKPGTERINWILNELGNPQKTVKAIHIVGTNGKGSTVNYLQKIFSLSGYDVGTFVSPYIIDFRERISINGQMLEKDVFVELVRQIHPIVERLPLETKWTPATEFEIITAIMFLYFGKIRPVDIAFIEAGLGGLYDSTNVFEPMMVICPSIGLDHQDVLGDSYREIAAQKAGVVKGQVPFLYVTDREDVRAIFTQKAAEVGATCLELGRDFFIEEKQTGFDFIYKRYRLENLLVSMPGSHQIQNASLALLATYLLKDTYSAVTETDIRKALLASQWIGRTEWIKSNLMIDGAHNKESVQVLVDVLKSQYKDKKIHILFAAIETKPVDDMLLLLQEFEDIQVTTFDYPTSYSLDRYPIAYQRVETWQEWLQKTYQESSKDLYVITGSLYFISQVRREVICSEEES